MSARTYLAGARISGFWRHLGSPRVLGVHAVRLRVSATLDLAKSPISVAPFLVAIASLGGVFSLGRGSGRAAGGFPVGHFLFSGGVVGTLA